MGGYRGRIPPNQNTPTNFPKFFFQISHRHATNSIPTDSTQQDPKHPKAAAKFSAATSHPTKQQNTI